MFKFAVLSLLVFGSVILPNTVAGDTPRYSIGFQMEIEATLQTFNDAEYVTSSNVTRIGDTPFLSVTVRRNESDTSMRVLLYDQGEIAEGTKVCLFRINQNGLLPGQESDRMTFARPCTSSS